jgi:hypothetical protein
MPGESGQGEVDNERGVPVRVGGQPRPLRGRAEDHPDDDCSVEAVEQEANRGVGGQYRPSCTSTRAAFTASTCWPPLRAWPSGSSATATRPSAGPSASNPIACGYQWISAEDPAYAEEMGPYSCSDLPYSPFFSHYFAVLRTGMHRVKLG